MKWENIRDGIAHTFAQFIYRLELAAEKKKRTRRIRTKLTRGRKRQRRKLKKS